MIVDQEVDEFLAHYGVKGMKWGVRKDNFQRNRALNKESRAKDKAKRAAEFEKTRKALRPSGEKSKINTSTKEGRKAAQKERQADIDRARARINTGAARADAKEAKAQYKKDKEEIGSRAARQILRAKRNELYKDAARANEIRDGYEATIEILNIADKALKDFNEESRRLNRGGRP